MGRVRGASEDVLNTAKLNGDVENGVTEKIDCESSGSRNMAQRPERYSLGRLDAGGGAIKSRRHHYKAMERVSFGKQEIKM